ncbi:MAG: acyltransferase [Sediminibacterium sp.]
MKSNVYIPALTGVRAIAAFLVFFHHFNQAEFPYPLFRILNEFHIGVTLFFVLSGFLICLRYFDTCEINGTWFRKYLKNRIARIYPMYLILTVATFAFAWWIGDHSVYNNFFSPVLLIFLNIFFIRGFFDDLKFTGVSQGWSLTVEECFYFMAPFFFLYIKKTKKALFYLPLILLGIGVLLVLIFGNLSFWGFFGNLKFMFLYTFFGRCVEFFIGMALALVILKSDNTVKKYPLFTLLGIVVMAASVGIMAIQPIDTATPYGLYQPVGIFSNNVLLPIGIALFFYGLMKEKSLIRYWLSGSLMQLLGKSSYIFYLIHIGFISKLASDFSEKNMDRFYAWLDANEYWWLSEHINYTVVLVGMVFIILNLVSIILYKFIEEPVNLYIRKSSLLEKKKVATGNQSKE